MLKRSSPPVDLIIGNVVSSKTIGVSPMRVSLTSPLMMSTPRAWSCSGDVPRLTTTVDGPVLTVGGGFGILPKFLNEKEKERRGTTLTLQVLRRRGCNNLEHGCFGRRWLVLRQTMVVRQGTVTERWADQFDFVVGTNRSTSWCRKDKGATENFVHRHWNNQERCAVAAFLKDKLNCLSRGVDGECAELFVRCIQLDGHLNRISLCQ